MTILNTPVAFIVFNRPDLTQIVFNAIRQAQPKQLFVIADGARFPEEAEKCQQARDVIKQVDWDCQVLTNYADTNLGCRQRVSSGITWVFEQVEEAIILEDDCLPHPSFFHYCETLLEYYRDDKRVMVISGDNFQDGHKRTKYSYYFSKYNHCWGWASWRRAWKYWEFKPEKWTEFRDAGLMEFVCDDHYEKNYWIKIFDTLFLEGKPNSWAYAWTFACWSQGGLTALPNVNLVSNIGFGADATHTEGESKFANLPTEDIGEIYHPHFVIKNREADIFSFDHVFGGKKMKETDNIYGNIRVRIANVKQYITKNCDFINMLKKNLKNVINKIGYKFLKIDKEEAKFLENTYRLYEKYSSYTMIPKNTFIENLKLCRNLSTIHGCVVECGVWRGGMIASIAEILGKDRNYYLFDSFEGLPEAKEIDGKDALAWQRNKDNPYFFDNCKAETVYADTAMKMAEVSKYQLVKGWFSDTIPNFKFDEDIAILRLDGDWYDSTMQCMEFLYPKVAKGGVIIVDDYYVWDGCSRAIHDYLSIHKIPCRIRQIQSNCYIIKE